MSGEGDARAPREDGPLDPAVDEAFAAAFGRGVDVDTSARHLWRLHTLAAELGPVEQVAQRAPAVPRRRLHRASVGALVLAILVAFPAIAIAVSGQAEPGDSLYALKRAHEQTKVALARSPEDEAWLWLQFARVRVDEAVRADNMSLALTPDLIDEALDAVRQAEALGGPVVKSEAQSVRRAASESATAIADRADPSTRARLQDSARRLEEPEAHPTAVTRRKDYSAIDAVAVADDGADADGGADADDGATGDDGAKPDGGNTSAGGNTAAGGELADDGADEASDPLARADVPSRTQDPSAPDEEASQQTPDDPAPPASPDTSAAQDEDDEPADSGTADQADAEEGTPESADADDPQASEEAPAEQDSSGLVSPSTAPPKP